MEPLQLMNSFGLAPNGILHIGANYGQEFESYVASGAKIVVYVEPISTIFDALKSKVEQARGHHAVRAVCSDKSGETVRFNISSNAGLSSSILGLGNHGKIHPDIVYVAEEVMTTTTVDELLAREFPGERFDLMVIDVQGAELMVLRGATETLAQLDAVYPEISESPLYDGGCTWRELDAYLSPLGFMMKYMSLGPTTYGDALFLKNEAFGFLTKPVHIDRPGKDIARGKPATQSSLSQWSRPNDAQGAVDGTLTGSFAFHTGFDANPWWQVDLQTTVAIDEVLVFNRLDSGRERAYPFVLKLGSETGDFREVYCQRGIRFGGLDGKPARIELGGAPARYVRIELPGEGYLHLDGVEIYGKPA